MDKIKFYRNKLDRIDEKIAVSIAKKIDIVNKFWEWKKANNVKIIDKKRKMEIVRKNSRKSGLRKEFLKKIYDEIRKEVKR